MITSSRTQQGFTLIELMIGVVILALLIGVVTFGLGRIVNQDMKSTQAELQIWLNELGLTALNLNQYYQVNVSDDSLSVSRLFDRAWIKDPTQPEFQFPADVSIQVVRESLNKSSQRSFVIDNTGTIRNQLSIKLTRGDEQVTVDGSSVDK